MRKETPAHGDATNANVVDDGSALRFIDFALAYRGERFSSTLARRLPALVDRTGAPPMVVLRRHVGLCTMICKSHQISATAPIYTT